MEATVTWQSVTHGSNWEHRKTGKKCIVQSTARSNVDSIELLHESGRLSRKQVHYFMGDFKPLASPLCPERIATVAYKVQFPVGTKVRMKAEAIQGYYVAVQQRVKDGRIGIVTGHTLASEMPMVMLPKDGRKQAYNVGAIRVSDWDVVELPQTNS